MVYNVFISTILSLTESIVYIRVVKHMAHGLGRGWFDNKKIRPPGKNEFDATGLYNRDVEGK